MTHKSISVLASLLNGEVQDKAEILSALSSIEELILENEDLKRKLDRIRVELER